MELLRICDVVSHGLPLILCNEVKIELVFEMVDEVNDTVRFSKQL